MTSPAAHSAAPPGKALVLVAPASFAALEAELNLLGYQATATDNPYDAFIELLERPLVYRALVVSLPALYREELTLIKSVRSRLSHIDVILAHTDGRHAALADAMRLGATALLSEEAIHRLADVEPTISPPTMEPDEASASSADNTEPADDELEIEPLLTAEELRALLQEQPTLPPP